MRSLHRAIFYAPRLRQNGKTFGRLEFNTTVPCLAPEFFFYFAFLYYAAHMPVLCLRCVMRERTGDISKSSPDPLLHSCICVFIRMQIAARKCANEKRSYNGRYVRYERIQAPLHSGGGTQNVIAEIPSFMLGRHIARSVLGPELLACANV